MDPAVGGTGGVDGNDSEGGGSGWVGADTTAGAVVLVVGTPSDDCTVLYAS